MEYIRITKENIDLEHICCAMSGKQSLAKKEWMKNRFEDGLVFYRSKERGKCFIEYIPSENAWIPIEAGGYIYINCLWIAGSMKALQSILICYLQAFFYFSTFDTVNLIALSEQTVLQSPQRIQSMLLGFRQTGMSNLQIFWHEAHSVHFSVSILKR